MWKGTGLGKALEGRDSMLGGTLGGDCACGGPTLDQGHPQRDSSSWMTQAGAGY